MKKMKVKSLCPMLKSIVWYYQKKRIIQFQEAYICQNWSEKLVAIVEIGHKMVVLDYCNGQANDLHCISWWKWFLNMAKLEPVDKIKIKIQLQINWDFTKNSPRRKKRRNVTKFSLLPIVICKNSWFTYTTIQESNKQT